MEDRDPNPRLRRTNPQGVPMPPADSGTGLWHGQDGTIYWSGAPCRAVSPPASMLTYSGRESGYRPRRRVAHPPEICLQAGGWEIHYNVYLTDPKTGKNIYLLGFVSLLNDISSEIIQPILPLFITSLGGGAVAVGLIGGISDGLPSILQVFVGYWSDRWGRRKPLVVAGYALSAASKLLLPISASWQQVFVLKAAERSGKGVRSSLREVFRFLKAELWDVVGVFGVILLLVVLATVLSIAATAGLGLIAFVPVATLIMLPLQLAAWLLRNLVFQYLGLTALAAYLHLYEPFAASGSPGSARRDMSTRHS